jgi:hypothetical protein
MGFFRAAANQLGVAAGGAVRGVFSSTGLAVTGTLTATGTLSGGTSGTAYSFSGSAPATSLALDSSGNLLVGSSSSYAGKFQSWGAVTANAGTPNISAIDTTSMALGVGGELAFIGQYQVGDYAYFGSIRGIKENATSGNTACALTFFTRPTATAPVERMRLDSSGNLGIGTSSPISKLTVLGAGTINAPETTTTGGSIQTASYGITARTGNLELGATDARAANIGGSLTFSARYTSTNATWVTGKIAGYRESATDGVASSYLAFATSTGAGDLTERARIDSSGNLLVGTTASTIATITQNALVARAANGSLLVHHENGNTGSDFAGFGYSGATIGTISQNSTTTVGYNTSSDYRLKNTITPMTGALAKVALLKPCTYKWNVDESDGDGFIAHELAEVCPHAVSGSKDAVDVDGNPKYQGIDTSFLVATLTAAIQEQQAIIKSLTARITALETA